MAHHKRWLITVPVHLNTLKRKSLVASTESHIQKLEKEKMVWVLDSPRKL
jgi:hypothetical protein